MITFRYGLVVFVLALVFAYHTSSQNFLRTEIVSQHDIRTSLEDEIMISTECDYVGVNINDIGEFCKKRADLVPDIYDFVDKYSVASKLFLILRRHERR